MVVGAAACAECGAPARPHSCEELFHVVLALDHSRREPWGPLHGVTVCCFLLQHPGRFPEAERNRSWAILRTYVDEGLAAAIRFTERARRANSHRHKKVVLPDGGVALPGRRPPTAFSVTIADVALDGTFPAAGFPERVTAWAEAVIAAWETPEAG